MQNKDRHTGYNWFYIVTIGVTIVVVLLAYYYFYRPALLGPAEYANIGATTNEGKNIEYVRKSKVEILADIKAQFSITDFKSQLEQQEQLLQQKIKNTDLVEVIVLERELALQKTKIDNFKQRYDEKVVLLVDAYQSLENLKDSLTLQEIKLAQAALGKGDTDKAYALFSQVEFKQRNAREREDIVRGAEAAYLRGRIAEDQSDYRKAYRHYRRAVMFTPDNVQYLLAAANIGSDIALYGNAINFYDAALYIEKSKKEFSPNDFREIWVNLGVAWNSKGNTDKSIEYFELALASDLQTLGPTHPNIAKDKNYLGWAWETKGKIKKAIEYYQQALKENETNLGLTHPATLLVKENLEAAIRLSKGVRPGKKSK